MSPHVAKASAHWTALCARLGVKPRTFGLLCGALAAAVVALPLKSSLAPKRASAAPAAAAIANSAAPAAPGAAAAPRSAAPARAPMAIPEELLAPAPEFNLAQLPLRNPFVSLVPVAAGAGPEGSAMPAPADITLQATMDGDYAIINGQTLMRGQAMVDRRTGRSWTLVEVSSRRVRLSCDGVVYEARMGG